MKDIIEIIKLDEMVLKSTMNLNNSKVPYLVIIIIPKGKYEITKGEKVNELSKKKILSIEFGIDNPENYIYIGKSIKTTKKEAENYLRILRSKITIKKEGL